jgi:hypothetical protein
MAARIFLGLFGALTAPYGLYCLLRPQFLAEFAGVAAISTTGTIELRAMYGGLQTGFGLLALLGAAKPVFARSALLAAAFLCAGLGLSRTLSSAVAAELSSYTAQGLAFELGATLIAVWLLRRTP